MSAGGTGRKRVVNEKVGGGEERGYRLKAAERERREREKERKK